MSETEVETEADQPDDEHRGSRSNTFGILSIGIAVLSLILASASALLSYGTRVDTLRAGVVEDLFESFEEWSALTLDNPYLLHLLASQPRYDYVSGLIEDGVGQLDDDRVIELLLAEMAMADVLVAAYDEMLVDLTRAEDSGDDFVIGTTTVPA